MRWVLVSAQHAPEHGGIGSYVTHFVRHAVRAGWEIHLVTRRGAAHPAGAIVHEVRTADEAPSFAARICGLRRLELIRPYRYGLWSLAAARALLELDVDPDVIEVIDSQGQGFVTLGSDRVRQRYPGVPIVMSAHATMGLIETLCGEDERRFGRAVYHDWERRAIARADAVFAPSRTLLTHLALGDRGHVVPHPLPVTTAPRRRSPAEERVLLVGSMERAKGVDVWAQSLDRVLRARPEARAILIGPDRLDARGDSRVRAVRGALDPSLRARLTWAGALRHAEVATAIDGAALVVIPSVLESFSYVGAEALLAGCPVLITPAVGLGEWAPSVARTCSGDVGALAEAQIHLLSDREAAEMQARIARDELMERCAPERVLGTRQELVAACRAGPASAGATEDAMDRVAAFLAGVERQEHQVAPRAAANAR